MQKLHGARIPLSGQKEERRGKRPQPEIQKREHELAEARGDLSHKAEGIPWGVREGGKRLGDSGPQTMAMCQIAIENLASWHLGAETKRTRCSNQ